MSSDPSNQLVDHFFRHESANLIAVLARAFGFGRIEMIEDMVQVAMLEALNAWRYSGIPENPAAWIHRKAKHRILDTLRRERTLEKALAFSGQSIDAQEQVVDQWLAEDQLPDSLLRMMFVCCNPSLDRKAQIALTLKTLCGFGISEIARGLMLPDETVKKRVQRARKRLSEANVTLDLPPLIELEQRLAVVHDVLYLMFNEGYSTSRGSEPIRDDICEEAARLCHLICQSNCCSPATRALLALQLFHSSRLDSRVDDDGGAILLEDQNRSKWDPELIHHGRYWLAKSKTKHPTVYHYEAAIAMKHCVAQSVDQTDWNGIVELYDRLVARRDSPIYRLNRAIAIGQTGDTLAALRECESLGSRKDMQDYLLLDCAIARLHRIAGDTAQESNALRRALLKSPANHERAFIERRLNEIAQEGR